MGVTQPISAVTVEGTITRIVHQRERFRIVKLKLDSGEVLSVTGQFPSVTDGSRVRVTGRKETHERFGEQIRASSIIEISHHSLEGLVLYLSGGSFPGVGKVMAKKVVDHFGEQTLDVLSQHIDRLVEVKGLTEKAQRSLEKSWKLREGIHDLMVFMREAGMGQVLAEKIFDKYGAEAMTILRRQPYRLAQEVDGIGFLTADKLASSVGIAKDSIERVRAAVRHALQTGQDERGDTAFTAKALEAGTRRALVEELENFDELFQESLGSLVAEREAEEESFNGVTFYYRPRTRKMEQALADRIWDIAHTPPKEVVFSEDAEKAVDEFESTSGLELGEQQKMAVLAAAEGSILVVTGGPGTGKTTILKAVLHAFTNAGLHAALASPTGRAAKRMQEATGKEAQTIHRLLRYSPEAEAFRCGRDNPIAPICEACFGSGKRERDREQGGGECEHCRGTGNDGKPYDVVIIDETSMLDLYLATKLIEAVPDGSRLILVGDVNQLPSVGPGCVLRDIIECGLVPVVTLDRIYRQADGERSLITENAHGILRGDFPESDKDRDFLMLRDHKDGVVAREKVVALVRALIDKKGFKPEDIQVLVPQHKGDAGNTELNRVLQDALNPLSEGGEEMQIFSGGTEYRRGDRVMQLKNNYELGVFNGEVGYIVRAGRVGITVEYEDPNGTRLVEYKSDSLSMLKLAYASTIHKAQGSEYPAVIVVLLSQAYWMLNRNLVYTAITRGQKQVVVVTDVGAKSIKWAITQKGSDRVTTLAERIRQLEGS